MSLNVLLVEPDAALADEIRRALGPAGLEVTSLSAGEPALERCRQAPPDLILLAAELPDMSGFSVCNRLKRAAASVPLLLYTGDATDAAVEAHRATRTRADDYLRKPFDMAELLGRAAALLHGDGAGPRPPPSTPPIRPRRRGPTAAGRHPSATRPPAARARRLRPGRGARARRRPRRRLGVSRRAASARRAVPRLGRAARASAHRSAPTGGDRPREDRRRPRRSGRRVRRLAARPRAAKGLAGGQARVLPRAAPRARRVRGARARRVR